MQPGIDVDPIPLSAYGEQIEHLAFSVVAGPRSVVVGVITATFVGPPAVPGSDLISSQYPKREYMKGSRVEGI